MYAGSCHDACVAVNMVQLLRPVSTATAAREVDAGTDVNPWAHQRAYAVIRLSFARLRIKTDNTDAQSR